VADAKLDGRLSRDCTQARLRACDERCATLRCRARRKLARL